MALASIALFRYTGRQKAAVDVTMSEIVAPRGSKTHIVLADGTAIWLNAGSKLRYPQDFSLENREVFLAGEAYFKVPHNDEHSFIVHTPEATIRDLGTVFNVKAYTGSPVTEATLIEGAIEVSLEKKPDRKIRMSPGEKLVLHNKLAPVPAKQQPEAAVQLFEVSKIVPYAKTNDIVETAWVEDKLIFRNERFEDLAQMMERRYNISIVIKDQEIRDYQVTGIFRQENITEALKLLQVIVPFKYKMSNGQVIINK
jgi:ferric-dicitrate binding protein FerR (iron transport regulator)